MFEEQAPQPAIFHREFNVGVGQTNNLLTPVLAGACGLQSGFETVEKPRFDRQDNLVPILEGIIERAGRIIDLARNLARGKSFQAVVLDQFSCRLKDGFPQLLGRLLGALWRF